MTFPWPLAIGRRRSPWWLALFVILVATSCKGGSTNGANVVASGITKEATATTLAVCLFAALLAPLLSLPLVHVFRARATTVPGAILRFFVFASTLAGTALPPVWLGGVVASAFGLGPAPPSHPGDLGLRCAALGFSLAAAFAPLSALLAGLASSAVPADEHRAAATLVSARTRWRIVHRPRLRQCALLSALFTGIAASTDAATPPHFGMETLASRSALLWQTTLDEGTALLPLLPVVIAGPLTGLFLLRRARPERRSIPPCPPALSKVFLSMASCVAIGIVLLPLAFCAARAVSERPALTLITGAHSPEVSTSFKEASILAASGALLAALAVGLRTETLSRQECLVKTASRALWILPLSLPGLAFALALALLLSLGPGTENRFGYELALGLRVLPWIGLTVLMDRSKPEALAARALGLSRRCRILLALRSDAWPAMKLAAFLCAAGSLRETDLHTALGQAGGEPLATRFAQSLHYGFLQDGAEIGTTMGLVASLLGVLGAMAFMPRGQKRGWAS